MTDVMNYNYDFFDNDMLVCDHDIMDFEVEADNILACDEDVMDIEVETDDISVQEVFAYDEDVMDIEVEVSDAIPLKRKAQCVESLKKQCGRDGYKWQKYGRKRIKSDVKHYYRCSEEGCDAKKQIVCNKNILISSKLIGSHTHEKYRTINDTVLQTQVEFIKFVHDYFNNPVLSEITMMISKSVNPHMDKYEWSGYGSRCDNNSRLISYYKCSGYNVKKKISVGADELTELSYIKI